MAITKIYRAKISYLSTFVYVKGKAVKVVFSGGNDQTGGIFTTADQEVQKEIERSQKFIKGEIKLIKTYGEEDVKTIEAAIRKADNLEGSNPSTCSAVKVYPMEINTVQKAGRALNADFNIPIKSVETKAKLFEKATELKVEFPGVTK